MRTKFTAFVAASVDGRISLDPGKSPDWTSREDQIFFRNALSKFDAVVMGWSTFEAARKNMEKRTTFVLSSRPGNPVREKFFNGGSARQGSFVTFVNPLRAHLRDIFGKFKTVAVLGGGRVYQTMLDEKLMDEIYVTVEPLIFGQGIPMFVGGASTAHLRLVSVEKLNKIGTVLLHYKIRK